MMRRSPTTILLAHKFDPARRELFVEGSIDRSLLEQWLGTRKHSDARITEIKFVDLPQDLPGGERGRLMHFARAVSPDFTSLKFFADADFDRLLNRPTLPHVWLTDGRDLESYLLNETCLCTAIRLGVNTDSITGSQLLKIIKSIGRQLGLLRAISERDSYNLPFQRTKLARFLTVKRCTVTLDLNRYLASLLNNADPRISLRTRDIILTQLQAAEIDYAKWDDFQIIHGKDLICLFECALKNYGAPKHCDGYLWLALDKAALENYAQLKKVKNFLT